MPLKIEESSFEWIPNGVTIDPQWISNVVFNRFIIIRAFRLPALNFAVTFDRLLKKS